ncbi:ATP-binding protein [Actinomadura mexicana]|uniref:Anti-sigma regulatory factor (Ser/Thr protein kinase) n=1 Tax=Actinomadura mexicana TaxID=134959 RepID=A0A238Y7M8_9ACTN|nr:ATP-binding protein [Actinomadura mexicana]SNR66349.1 Anti-sigma regulatory factor (Ser/Thr protein kinase) [Actinomadura mexicana]
MAHGHLPDLVLGGCSAWPLPADETCAGVARAHLRAALTAAKAPGGLVEDVMLAASELVTNGLRHGIGGVTAFTEPLPGRRVLELWAYHRVTPESQLVFKVFDPNPGWTRPAKKYGTWAENGRGIAVVDALSSAWGWHRTRSRLGPLPVPGKATWFCVPVARMCAQPHRPRPLPREAAVVLRRLLMARGLDGTRCHHGSDRSVVTMRGLTVWSEPPGVFRWRIRPGARDAYACRPFADLHDVADEVVCHHEHGVVSEAGGR